MSHQFRVWLCLLCCFAITACGTGTIHRRFFVLSDPPGADLAVRGNREGQAGGLDQPRNERSGLLDIQFESEEDFATMLVSKAGFHRTGVVLTPLSAQVQVFVLERDGTTDIVNELQAIHGKLLAR